MQVRRFGLLLSSVAVAAVCSLFLSSPQAPVSALAQEAPAAASDVPKGVEVQARGPIHEAFATPTAEPKPTYGVPKKPPVNIEEMPPEEKPEGDAVWIGGYWGWDDDRGDFLWVSGCWRVKPQGKDWVSGYWREVSGQHQWVPGFWRTVEAQKTSEVTYYPEPPPPPQIAAPAAPAEPDMFYVPGHWMWVGDHYVWRAGYYTRVRIGHVYVASHYRWTPFGFVFVAGYWDYSIARRGVLYAPVVVDTVVVGPHFVYTPYYAVSDTILVDAYFVRPGFCHYYYGDYYGPRYTAIGFECGYHYSQRHYDAVVVYHRYEHRHTPGWYETRVSVTVERNAGRAPLPPRTLHQQNNVTIINNKTTNVYNTTVLAPTKSVVASRGAKTVPLDQTARLQVKESSTSVQKASITERVKTETVPHGTTPLAKPRTASMNLPHGPGTTHTLSGTTTQHVPGTTKLSKNPDAKGTTLSQPLTTKGAAPTDPMKTKTADGTTKASKAPDGTTPILTKPATPPDRPAATKKPAEEKKKKGG